LHRKKESPPWKQGGGFFLMKYGVKVVRVVRVVRVVKVVKVVKGQ
jgi:hypothetical protein